MDYFFELLQQLRIGDLESQLQQTQQMESLGRQLEKRRRDLDQLYANQSQTFYVAALARVLYVLTLLMERKGLLTHAELKAEIENAPWRADADATKASGRASLPMRALARLRDDLKNLDVVVNLLGREKDGAFIANPFPPKGRKPQKGRTSASGTLRPPPSAENAEESEPNDV